jgi:hypothetical protein
MTVAAGVSVAKNQPLLGRKIPIAPFDDARTGLRHRPAGGENLPPLRQHLLQPPMASIRPLTTPKRSVYPHFDPNTNPLTWVRFHSTSVKNPDMAFS